MTEQTLYLASKSPRRRELLDQIAVTHDVLTAEGGRSLAVDETPRDGELPADYTLRVAIDKAQAGVARLNTLNAWPALVLAADTTVEIDGEILGKPATPDAAIAMLERLSGSTHRVLSAVVVSDGQRMEHRLSVSEVVFRHLERSEIQAYVDSGDSADKAGAYGIQGRAAVFVKQITGSHSGIMGLPLFETAALLRAFDYPF